MLQNSIQKTEGASASEFAYQTFIEHYSLFRMAGLLENRKVLMVPSHDAVLGLEIAQKKVATFVTLHHPENLSGIEPNDLFDLILSPHGLCMARNKSELNAWVQQCYDHLATQGRFVGITDNPGNATDYYKKYKKYGFVKSTSLPRSEGSEITYTYYHESAHTTTQTFFHHSLETLESAFLQAGFKSFTLKNLTLSEKSKHKYNTDFWRVFLNHPPTIGIEAAK